jgi:hypothetical protein
MDLSTKLRYQGCISTPSLWKSDRLSPFKQIELARNPAAIYDFTGFQNHRLGKLVEEVVFHQLKSEEAISWICDNLQIQDGKRTVGEIDALYYYEGVPVHLEVAYKFYLFDTIKDYDEPLAYWIGPNRKDSLFYKLGKLHNKQFALLYNELTSTYLEGYNLELENIKQELCFKAQLFLPYKNRAFDVSPLNGDCVVGFYISYHEISLFSKFEFFIPSKLDWLVMPHHDVNWINYSSVLEEIEAAVNNKRSPLVWMRRNDGDLCKCFIVFW